MHSSKEFESELGKLENLLEKSESKANILNSTRINLADLKSQEAYLNRNYIECLKYLVESCLDRLESHKDSSNLKLKQLTSDDFLSKFDQAVHFQQTPTLLLINNDSLLRLLTSTQQFITDLPSNVSSSARNKSIYLNNLALLNFSMQKYNMSSYFLNKSLIENENFVKTSDSEESSSTNESMSHVKKLTGNSQNEILYNMGISLLFGKQPIAAFKCLYKVADVYNQNARLWLRLAECCIMCHQHSLVQHNSASTNNSSSTSADESEPNWPQPSFHQQIPSNLTTSFNEKIFKLSEKVKCVSKSFGQSFHHKIQIGSSLSKELNTSLNYNNYLSVSDLTNRKFDENFPKMLTLEFAFMCLKNALNLLPSNQQIFTMNRNNNDVFTYFFQLKSSSTSKLGQQDTGSSLTSDDQQTFASTETTQSANEQEPEPESVTNVDQQQSNNGGSPKQQLPTTSSNELLNQHQLDNKLFNCVWPSKPISILELQSLRSSILTSLAYVSLCLKDYTNTIKYSSMLLDTNDQLNSKYPISKGHRYLASSYLAEANLYLDKLNESIECLNHTVKLDSETDISFVPPKLIEQIQSTSNEIKSLIIVFNAFFFR